MQITGHRTFSEWTADWLLDLCVQNSAIYVTADYRLLSEANGEEIMDDMATFYLWLSLTLLSLLSSSSAEFMPDALEGVEADLDKLLIF
jgi:hypothetical protein